MTGIVRRRRWGVPVCTALLTAAALGAAGCGTPEADPLVAVEAELSPVLADRHAAEPTVELLHPNDGDEVVSPVAVTAILENSMLAPKGEVRDGEGHLHVLIDQPCVSPGTVIPDDALHIHVGSGEETVEIDLEPGPHRLCVQIGDGFHSATTIQTELDLVVTE